MTPGQTSDDRGFDLVMGDDLPAPGALLADKGHDADRIRAWAEARDAIPVIPMRRNRKARADLDKTFYALRNPVERCVRRLKNSRRVATRYDKTVASVLGFVDIACIRLWTRRFVNRTWDHAEILVIHLDQIAKLKPPRSGLHSRLDERSAGGQGGRKGDELDG
ncbi:Transposase [Jannaschia seosinensis]|uniref:Transposase n=1 Tax=Jannaschia seosinensis TaxID=313367 RepID=A0A0M7B902_9RHOB|nr:Transposase [Jannaschia seosinensis]